jgi:glycolate oxidase FAD binding subunit
MPTIEAPAILEPRDVPELASMLAQANREGWHVIPRGKPDLNGRPAHDTSTSVLSLARLSSPIDHCAGDLTATIPAGATLGAVNAALGTGEQWLPLDPPDGEASTIGGLVARNESGPRRHRHGSPRDLIIGIEMVLADGRDAKAGGRVVKNVAGYDLARLLCGSRGSLAVIVSATFKLAPLPQASCTVVAEFDSLRRAAEAAQLIASAPVTPSALEIATPPGRLLIRFETTPVAAEQQAGAAAMIAVDAGATGSVLTGVDEAEIWNEHARSVWGKSGTLAKICVLPTESFAVLESLAQSADSLGITHSAGGRAGLGVLYASLQGDPTQHASLLGRIRELAATRGGSVSIERAESSVLASMSRSSELGDTGALQRAVKNRFDPNGTLKPGNGPAGL